MYQFPAFEGGARIKWWIRGERDNSSVQNGVVVYSDDKSLLVENTIGLRVLLDANVVGVCRVPISVGDIVKLVDGSDHAYEVLALHGVCAWIIDPAADGHTPVTVFTKNLRVVLRSNG